MPRSRRIVAAVVECIPNFSEGRRKDVVDALAGEARAVAGVRVLDVEMDANHNRCVLTFVGGPAAAKEAAFRMAARAVALIDLNRHEGEHPRLGALDVLPFVPISGVSMEDCVALARDVGKRIADELGVPVYLYESAATRPDRRNLADVRKGQFEGLRAEIETNPDRKPDFGPAKIHPTAGATVVGARPPLIAYNVNLGTADLSVAKKIAGKVREKGGGLPAVKALGFELKDRGIVQVSMNLVDYKRTGIAEAFEAVKDRAEEAGVPVVGSEIVGLVPLEALVGVGIFTLRLENFKAGQILETRLWE